MQGVERKSIRKLKNKYEQIVNFDFFGFFRVAFCAFISQFFLYTYPHLCFCVVFARKPCLWLCKNAIKREMTT